MQFKFLSAAVVAAGLFLGLSPGAAEAKTRVHIYVGVPGVYIGTPGYRRYHCHRVVVWRHGHRVWRKICHRHRHRH